MGEVVQFPVRRASDGPVYCDVRDVAFPQVIRVVQTLTASEIAKNLADAVILIGDPSPIRPGTYVDYDLDTTHFVQVTSWEPVHVIATSEMKESLVIRYHASENEAGAYVMAFMDLSFDRDAPIDFGPSIYRTDQGIFTFAKRPTREDWPGPMIIYLATRPEPDGLQREWCVAVGPDGKRYDPVELEII